MLVSTKVAAKAVKLSEYELRTGYKQGKYPALEIGFGTRAKRLRWDIKLLKEAIDEIMRNKREENLAAEEALQKRNRR